MRTSSESSSAEAPARRLRRLLLSPDEVSDMPDEDPPGESGTEPDRPTTPTHTGPSGSVGTLRRFGARHLGAIGVFVVVALLFVSVTLLRARADEVPLTIQSGAQASSGLGDSTGASAPAVPASLSAAAGSASPSVAVILVHVTGRVAHPGVVRLPEGARVNDALTAAGGATSGAVLGDLNLAEPLADGSQVVIGPIGAEDSRVRAAGTGGGAAAGGNGGGAGAGAPSSAGAQLDLNTATAEQFEALPGIGPVTAQSIVAWRTEHGRFTAVEELQEIDGIGPKTFQKLAPLVKV